MRKKQISIIFLIVILIAYAISTAWPVNYPREQTYVSRVVDGDTIIVGGGRSIRLLNIDTRERGENCYQEAKDRLEELLLLKNITMERDRENEDRYDRLLRYVYLDGEMINLRMVREGLAIVYIIEPNSKYREQFVDAEQLAREENGCIWVTEP